MSTLKDVTLGDLAKGATRYRPFIIAVAAIALIAVVLPGHNRPGRAVLSSGSGFRAGGSAGGAGGGTENGGTGPGAAGGTDSGAAGTAVGTGPGGAVAGHAAAGARAGGPGGAAVAGDAVAPALAGAGASGALGPDCDQATHRVKVPSLYAFPCVPAFAGNNGGATYQGVTKDTITIAYYQPQDDPTTKAILAAGGDNDSDAQIAQQYKDYAELFSHHTQLYGRHVNVVLVAASGSATDDTAAKADAVKVATQIHAFASWGAPTGTTAYVNELTARGVVCICTTTLPKDFYLSHAPYVWGNGLPDENQAYTLRAEYIGKRLAGRKAKFAGDPTLTVNGRTFGLIYYETTDHAYAAGEKFFEEELARYNVHLRDKASYVFDTSQAQNQAKTIIAKFASEHITSVIFVGDPIYPVFYTGAATNQNYHPEWIITGSALTDWTFFARTYDKSQWKDAFGISLLAARGPKAETDAVRLLDWQFHKPPSAPGTASTIYPTVWQTFLGIQMAGPNLNPVTYQQGMFSVPISPSKPGITNPAASWGRHVWGWDDYNVFDDSTEIWWDNTASGPDELGNNGVGMYEYVQGGKRYGAGQFPSSDPAAFDKNGAITIYSSLPPQDQYPKYPEKDYF